jgi:chemotaxis protein CheZ
MSTNERAAAPAAASPEVFQQLGQITRQLHEALNELGVMPRLQKSAAGLSDARSRLNYIASRTGEAAEKVLDAVELAKAEQAAISGAARQLASVHGGGISSAGSASGMPSNQATMHWIGEVEAGAARTDTLLTDIMLAQDFHDLTSQVVAKVVVLVMDLEDSLVNILLQAAPAEPACRTEPGALAGPVVEAAGRSDVVTSQHEVDDLLASLGF